MAERARGAVVLELVERWRKAGGSGLLYIAKSEREAEYLGANIHSLFPNCPVMVFPRWDCSPYDPAGPSRETMGRRASVLRRLAAPMPQPLVIATPEAALQRVPPRSIWRGATLTLRAGEEISPEALRSFLERTAYALDTLVDEPGEAAIHGQTIDVFPAGGLGPVRIDVTDGRVTAISSYDPATQRTSEAVSEIVLDAASEMIAAAPTPKADGATDALGASPWLSSYYERLETLFDYIPEAVVVVEPGTEERVALWLDQIRDAHESWSGLARAGLAPPETAAAPAPRQLYCDAAEWESQLRNREAQTLKASCCAPVPAFATGSDPSIAYRRFIAEQLAAGQRVVLAAGDARDIKTMSRRAGPAIENPILQAACWQDVIDASGGSLLAIEVDLEAGFLMPNSDVTVIAAADLLGSRARHHVPMELSIEPAALVDRNPLTIDGAVVHLDHGIALLRGIETVAASTEAPQETLRLEYAGGTTLMVPVQEIGSVWGYGSAGDTAPVDRLNGEAWTKRRAEIEGEIRESARTLLQLLRERERVEAPKLVPPPRQYERFAAGFPFLLTPDQAQAVEDVLADLNSGHPMDRLLCGDVGFGKTEVALRAAAAAVLSGKQVAVLVPTTVLARQHLGLFRRRFAGFGVRIELLSRLLKPAELRDVKQGLRDGDVAIVIGTHAIASKDVRFRQLALLVIDEEQRFGARIKEKLREFGRGLHVLTMSATPIPRTLQRALTGLQSVSALETPPARRLSVRTVATRFDAALVRDALSFERSRNGQSFFVCPHIEDLEPMSERLREIVPQLRVVVVHGKLQPAEVDEAVVAFAEGRGDVLLSTNIIEAGLDIPRANTILVWRPDRFGAAQLHQLRGRVGRGRRRGLAYLLTDPDVELPPSAEKRLQTLTELDRLGAGFAVSRRDLDLRGAGDLLGEAQAGHIQAIGLELYRYLLDRILAETRTGKAVEDRMVEVKLGIPASIPPDYVAEPQVRINLYARLARLRDLSHIEELADEIEDRFGPPPPATRNLLELARIGNMARSLGIAQVDGGPLGIALTFAPGKADSLRNDFAQEEDAHWSGDRLVLSRQSDTAERVGVVRRLLERLL